jgi:hypothetical protein
VTSLLLLPNIKKNFFLNHRQKGSFLSYKLASKFGTSFETGERCIKADVQVALNLKGPCGPKMSPALTTSRPGSY